MVLLYYLFILPLSLLPFRWLYILSDGLNFFLFKLVKYRKGVVWENLRNSFPNASADEIDRISSRFNHHLCDLIVESLKFFSIKEDQVKERLKCINPELVNRYYDQGRNVILVGGHYNNWELYGVAAAMHLKHQPIALYHPLKNKFLDQKLRATREKFGTKMISIRRSRQAFEGFEKPTATIFVTDQSPSNAEKAYWTTFLNQETGVMMGTEQFARKYDLPVIFGELRKVKRGHYEVEYSEICTHPSEWKEGAITEEHTKRLEEKILKAPEFWLWSHRRWKKQKPEQPRFERQHPISGTGSPQDPR